MSPTGLEAFDTTIQVTNGWLNEICGEMGWGRDHHKAYQALRAVLLALRDRLHPDEAAGLAAQLPLLVRGAFYEGWHPAGTPVKTRTRAEFLAPVTGMFRNDGQVVPAEVARAVFRVMKRHLSAGEVEDFIAVLPEEVQNLCV
jgi:uncharacterized protein (DUF2267 family)